VFADVLIDESMYQDLWIDCLGDEINFKSVFFSCLGDIRMRTLLATFWNMVDTGMRWDVNMYPHKLDHTIFVKNHRHLPAPRHYLMRSWKEFCGH
jgi:hypothetical protein